MGLGSKYGIIAETGNNIQTDGLIFYVDPAYQKSYTAGSSNTYNLASGSLTPTGSLQNSIGFEGLPTASWVLDGVDDYINCSTGGDICNFLSASAFSVSAWINYYIDTGGHASIIQIISRAEVFPPNGWSFCLNSDLKIELLLTTDGVPVSPERGAVSSVLSGESWRHVVGTWNGSTGGIYIDSIKDTTQIDVGDLGEITGSYPLFIGAIGPATGLGPAQFGSSSLGPVMVYDRALSAADIAQNYNAQKERFGY